MKTIAATLSVAILAILAGSCGFGAATVGIATSRNNNTTTTREATTLRLVTPESGQAGRTTLRIGLGVDARESLQVAAIEYGLGGSDSLFRPATPASGFPTELVAGSTINGQAFATRQDKFVRFVWNSHFDLDQLAREGAITRPMTARALVRVVVRNLTTREQLTATTEEFFLDQSLVATIVGGGVGDGASPSTASMLDPSSIAVDVRGSLYVADSGNNRIRKILTSGADAVGIETVIGNGFQGTLPGTYAATATSMNAPDAVASDAAGNLFVAEQVSASSSQLRYFERQSGLLSSFLGGFVRIRGLHMAQNQTLYIADQGSNSVWSLDLANVDPILNPPSLSNLRFVGPFTEPSSVFAVADATQQTVYVAERTGRRVSRRIGTEPPVIVAGGGAQTPAIGRDARSVLLTEPSAVAATATHLFVADLATDVVLCIDTTTSAIVNILSQVTTAGGVRPLAQPTGLTLGRDLLYIVETGDGLIAPGQRGQQVVMAQNPESPTSAIVVPFAAGEATKTVATAIGGIDTSVRRVSRLTT